VKFFFGGAENANVLKIRGFISWDGVIFAFFLQNVVKPKAFLAD
jgi:hypothetical protein